MIHTLFGRLGDVYENSLLVEVGGIGFKVFVTNSLISSGLVLGTDIRLFTFLYLREDHVALYGFSSVQDLELFSKLNGISGIGPRTAMGILSLASPDKLMAAINGGHVELLTKASGIGRKTAERIILELKGKINLDSSGEIVATMQSDADVLGALQNLGYSQRDAQDAVQKVDPSIADVPGRLKAALKLLKK